jgi:hypothetical protein
VPDPNSSNSQTGQSFGDKALEAANQVDTVARSASNLLTGGWANNVESANAALFDRSPGDWQAHYTAQLQNHLARDAYDVSHRRIAVALGDALAVGLMSRAGFLGGARGSAALPIRMKGQLGEGLSAAKTVLQGDRPIGFQVRKGLDNGKVTVVDHTTAKGTYVEAKFGPAAKLSPNQRYAQHQFGPLYRVDHWLPDHVGWITTPLGPAVGGLLSWGMHSLNAPQDNLRSGGAPANDITSNGTSTDGSTQDDVDGGSQYGGWQDDFGYPAAN